MVRSFPVIAIPKIPHSLEPLPPIETQRAAYWDAKGVAHTSPGKRPGFMPPKPSGALKARLILAWHEAGRWPATAKRAMTPGRCPGLV